MVGRQASGMKTLDMVKALTEHAKENKITHLEAGDIKIVLHPVNFIDPETISAKPYKESDEERLERERREQEDLLFHSSN